MLSVNQNFIILDDNISAVGGTALTLNSILEPRKQDCFFIPVDSVTNQFIEANKSKIWIIGNFLRFFQNSDKIEILIKILNECKSVKVEFDFNFCPYRSETGHEIFMHGEKCECPHGSTGNPVLSKVYDLITNKCLHSFFMSERQRAIYSVHMPTFDFSRSSILSSCFTTKNFELFQNLSQNQKNHKYAVLQGTPGFHAKAKGVKEAKEYCEANNLQYDILPTQEFEKHLETLSYYKGLVFLPIIDDTCPRCIIEARLMNLDVICNANCQHIFEFWWKDKTKTLEYLKSRPAYFWSIIDSL